MVEYIYIHIYIYNFIPWAGCDNNTNKSTIYFLVDLSFHRELNKNKQYYIILEPQRMSTCNRLK